MAFVAWRCPLSRPSATGWSRSSWPPARSARPGASSSRPSARTSCANWAIGTTRPSASAASFMRSFSTFLQPFPFAFFLMIVVLVGIPIALDDPARLRNRHLPRSCCRSTASACSSRSSRGAWIGTAVGLLWLGIRRHRILLLGIPIALIVLLGRAEHRRLQRDVVDVGRDAGPDAGPTTSTRLGDNPFGIGHRHHRRGCAAGQRDRGRLKAGTSAGTSAARTPRTSRTTSTSSTRSTSALPACGATSCSCSPPSGRRSRRANARPGTTLRSPRHRRGGRRVRGRGRRLDDPRDRADVVLLLDPARDRSARSRPTASAAVCRPSRCDPCRPGDGPTASRTEPPRRERA